MRLGALRGGPVPTAPRATGSRGLNINFDAQAIVRLEHASKSYPTPSQTIHALDDIHLEVNRGEFVSVMGPSGSGKSTAIQIIGCLDRLTAGRYVLCGTPIEQMTDNELAIMRNRYLGFIFQQFHLLPQLSALENVMLPMLFAGVSKDERRQRASAALERLGLGHRLNNKPNQLSGGEQQRTAIARAVVNRPILLLADEPTGNLDSRSAQEVIDNLLELHREQQLTIILVTHDDRVAALAQRKIFFRNGKIDSQS